MRVEGATEDVVFRVTGLIGKVLVLVLIEILCADIG